MTQSVVRTARLDFLHHVRFTKMFRLWNRFTSTLKNIFHSTTVFILQLLLVLNIIKFLFCYSFLHLLVSLTGGANVRPAHSQPWMVALIWNREGLFLKRQFCAGTLIDKSHFLTQAHCMPMYDFCVIYTIYH